MLALTEGILPMHRALRRDRITERPPRDGFIWWRLCWNTAACWPQILRARARGALPKNNLDSSASPAKVGPP